MAGNKVHSDRVTFDRGKNYVNLTGDERSDVIEAVVSFPKHVLEYHGKKSHMKRSDNLSCGLSTCVRLDMTGYADFLMSTRFPISKKRENHRYGPRAATKMYTLTYKIFIYFNVIVGIDRNYLVSLVSRSGQ